MWKIRKILTAMMVPASLLALSFAAVEGVLPLMLDNSSLAGHVLPLAPYGLAVLGVVFGLVFRNERVAYAAVALALGSAALVHLWPVAPATGASWSVAYPALAVLLPAYLLYAAMFSAQGVFGVKGLLRLLLIVVAVEAVLMAADGVLPPGLEAALDSLLHSRLFARQLDSWSHLPQPAIILITVASVILLGRLVLRPEPTPAAFLGAMLAAGGALDAVGNGLASAIYLAAAEIMLLAALVFDAYGMAFLDELTGLPGRRALMADFRRLGPRYTLAMVDIDHFKEFNDTYGHDVGDQVLQMVASKLSAVGGGGASFRYGGEEFTVLFPGKEMAHSRPHLEDLRLIIAGASFRLRGKDRPDVAPRKGESPSPAGGQKKTGVTVSIGVAEATGEDGKVTPEDILKEADKALYRAKKAGRNRLA